MADPTFRLGIFESKIIVPIQSFEVGSYVIPFGSPAGNSLLSSIFVSAIDAGGAVKVNYFDFGPGDGSQPGERIELEGHDLISAGQQPISDRRLVTRISNKPQLEIIVTGAPVTIGVHITVVGDFPQEAAIADGQLASLAADKGTPLMLYDPTVNRWYAARGVGGQLTLAITTPGIPKIIPTRFTSIPTTEQTTLTATVPSGKTWALQFIRVIYPFDGGFDIMLNNQIIGSGVTGAASQNVTFNWSPFLPIVASDIVTVKFTAVDLPVVPVDTYLMYTEE